jgi:hypothetical protein
MSLQVIHNESSKLLAHHDVAVTVNELKAASLRSSIIGAADIARVAWEIASNDEIQPGPRVSALALLAKRHPEFSEKHELSADIRIKALTAVANMTEEQLLRLAGEEPRG